jgi:hypothetical protein
VSKDNIIKLIQPGNVDDQLTEILRNGARALLAQAVEAEVADFLGKHVGLKTEDGHQRVLDAHPPDQRAQLRLDLWPTSPSTRFPTPVAAKARPVPTQNRLGPNDREHLQDRWKPAIQPNKEPSIMVRQPNATMHPMPQDNQLMSKHRVLGFKPQLRLEWRGQDGQDETEQPDHSASLGDSVTSSTRIGFLVHTGSMDGLKLARFVRDRWPPIKIVATSGLVIVEDDDLPAGSVFLPKPYRSAQVVATLREMTGAA